MNRLQRLRFWFAQTKYLGYFAFAKLRMLMEPIALTLGQKFEVEKFSREIDSFEDLQQLRDLAKDLLVAWKQQQASTAWVIRQKEGLS